MHALTSTIKRRRLDRGWSQAELASRAGVSRKWLGELKAGKVSLELGMVLRVLDALGLAVTLEDVVRTPDEDLLEAVLADHRGRVAARTPARPSSS